MRLYNDVHTILEKQRFEAGEKIKTEKEVTVTNELFSLAKCICSEAKQLV